MSTTKPLARPEVLLFDVNETLLDLGFVKDSVNGVLLDEDGAALWFSSMLHHSLVMSVGGQYADLMDIGAAVLRMLARNRDVALSEEEAKKALSVMRSLPAHPDVRPALERLKGSGYRLATLTNSSAAGVKAQLEYASLDPFFERQLSVDTPRLFKPHRAVYEWAAQEMGVEPGRCMLVAAHGWDVAGARWAGLQAAFVARSGQQMFPLAEPPDVDVADFSALADALEA
ncbi:MAG: haloacid dehalogenase type II [Pseudomonadota bacterium]|nr:haloacid dehalogenase type II [Pseudomonadota bacterium]